MKILSDGFGWLADAADLAAARHDVVALTEADVAAAWSDPRPDWWRRLVPDGWVPDVAVFTAPEARPAPPHLAALPCPVALWVADWELNPQAIGWIADQVELVLVERPGVRALRRAGIRNVAELSPWTYRPHLHRPDPGAPAERDVGVLGTIGDPARERWLGRLAELPEAIAVEIAPGGDEAADARFLQRSRIVVEPALTGGLGPRCLQAAACGALVIVDAAGADEAARWFRPDAEIVVCDEAELADRIACLLAHEDERAAIAAAGCRRAAEHAPRRRMEQLLARLERLAAAPRTAVPATPRAAGAAAAYALSVAPQAADLSGPDQLLDAAERAAPDDAAVQVVRARLYARLAARGDRDAASAIRWAEDHLRHALAIDPRDAVARLSLAQLAAAREDADGARSQALSLAGDLRAGRAAAHGDRIPLHDRRADQLLRQRALARGDDPRRELARLTLVAALRLAAGCTRQPGRRAELLTEAAGLAPEDPSIRVDLAVCCFALAPETAIAHTRLLLAARPVNPAVWMLHAHALVAAGEHDEALAFGEHVERLARRIHVSAEHLARVRAAVALARPHRAVTSA